MQSAQNAIALALLASTAPMSTAGPLDWLAESVADNPKTSILLSVGAGLWAGLKLGAGGASSKTALMDQRRKDDAALAKCARGICDQIPEGLRPRAFELNSNPDRPFHKCFSDKTAPQVAYCFSIGALLTNLSRVGDTIVLYDAEGQPRILSHEQRGRWFEPTDVTVCEATSVQGYTVLPWQPPKTKRERELAELAKELEPYNKQSGGDETPTIEGAASETLAADTTDGTPADTEPPAGQE